MTFEEYRVELIAFENAIVATCPDEGYKDLAKLWLQHIAIDRAKLYGVDFWQRFGARGVFPQLLNCWYRYRHLHLQRDDPEAYKDTMVDTFGFCVLYALSMKVDAYQIAWGTMWFPDPKVIPFQEHLISHCWDQGKYDLHSAREAFRLAYSEYRLGEPI